MTFVDIIDDNNLIEDTTKDMLVELLKCAAKHENINTEITEMSLSSVSKEEIQYYINNINIGEKIQVNMVSLWFAKYFSSTNMLKYVKIDQYATLIAIMMRMMKRKGFIILQYLMCGKVIRLNPKKNVTAKMLNKIQPRIDRIIETKYTRTSQTVEKSGIILDLLNFALFADMELISYDNEKMRGVRIDVNRVSEDLIIEEVLRFINEI